MSSNIYVEVVTVGGVKIFHVNANPAGIVQAPIGSLAISNQAGAVTTYQNLDGGTAWGPVGGGPLSHLVLVDNVTGDDAAAGIGNGVPFATIQAAINAIVADNAVGPIDGKKGYLLRLAPWQMYDEDVFIDVSNALHLTMLVNGNGLGQFLAADWDPTTPRSLVLTGSPANVNGIRPGIFICSDAWSAWKPTTGQAYAGLRIGGDIDGTTMTAGNLEFAFEGEVWGNVDFGATAIVSSYWRQTRIKGIVNGNNLLIFRARYSRFEGAITCSNYSLFDKCRIQSGMTVGGLGGVAPQGFFGCEMAGAFDCGGPGRLRLDAASNTTFVDNGATLGGTTTKKLLDTSFSYAAGVTAATPVVGPHTAAAWERVLYDPAAAPYQIDAPPSPSKYDRWSLKNVTVDGVSVITISGNGHPIEDPSLPGSFAPAVPGMGAGLYYEWEYDGTVWIMI